ncbi:MAG: mechanosensitive ion channel [Clostridia bacterium]|nr:mechanosensitive ion channel [Clostridia bacterium]
MKNILNQLIDFAMTAGIRLVGSALIIIIGFMVTNKVTKAVKKSRNTEKIDKNVLGFILSFSSISLKIIIILTAANYLGVPMTNVVAIIGSCGLAVGLALQGSLSNLAGGIMILVFKPFRDGDFVSINGLDGTVKNVTILYTYLVTPDNKTVVIPNATVSNSPIINYSTEKMRRADVSINLSYKCDVEKVRTVFLDFVKELPFVEKEPGCAVVISSYGESAITFSIRAWTKTEHYWDVVGSINYGLQKLVSENGFEIPYPQLDVHLDK